MSKSASIYTAVAAELLLWLLPMSCFLAAYVIQFNGPIDSVVPHVKLIASLAFAWMGLRLVIEHAGAPQSIRAGFQLLYSLALASLLVYYAVVLVGLDSWGRVATWKMIKVYIGQWRELMAVLDMPPPVLPILLGVILVGAFLLVRVLHARLPWPRLFADFARLRMSIVVAVAGLVLMGVTAVETLAGVNDQSGEPVMLSLNPGLGIELTQNNQSEGARLLDKREADAAAAYQPGELAASRNVILIVGDALRSSRMSLFGHSRKTTPYFDGLAQAREFAIAQPVYSVCAESYCGLMSIARSKFVHEFSRASLTLQQVLARHGYRISLMLGGDHTNFYGLSDALGPAELYWDGSMSSRYVNDDRAVIEQAAGLPDWDGQPAFLQFHLMSTHGLGQRQDEFMQFDPARNYYRRLMGADEDTRRTWATNFYDNGMLQFDATVKDLLATLEQNGYLDDALVIITGDHGEMLGELGLFGHAAGVRGPVLDTPLLMLRYGYEGRALEPRAFASQVDIAPTVLQELGLPIPPSWTGVGLHTEVSRDFLFFQQGQEIGLLDLRDQQRVWKYWTDLESEASFAHNITLDPEESQNLVNEVPAQLRSEWMLQLLPASNTLAAREF